jgi:putative Mg2+ transporter-C (MgtC) family protein
VSLTEFSINIFAALGLGIAIGLERQWRQHPAGLRTNALVALGAAMYVSLSMLFDHEASPTRVAAQVVSGLGFLGGGVILREGLNVRGLNTAATVWCSGAIGTLAGLSFRAEAAIGTLAVLTVHLGLRPIVRGIERHKKTARDVETFYRVRVACRVDRDALIRSLLLRHIGSHPHMSVQGLSTEDTEAGEAIVVADIFTTERSDRFLEELVARLSIEPDVTAVSWHKAEG